MQLFDDPGVPIADLFGVPARGRLDKEAVLCGAQRRRCSEVKVKLNRVAYALAARGIGRGRRRLREPCRAAAGPVI